jgi:cytochrome b
MGEDYHHLELKGKFVDVEVFGVVHIVAVALAQVLKKKKILEKIYLPPTQKK